MEVQWTRGRRVVSMTDCPGVDAEFVSPSVLSLETADNWASFNSKVTEPTPSFVGFTIRERFSHKGSLLLLGS